MNAPVTLGAAASAAWLVDRGLARTAQRHWFVEISVGSETADNALELNIYPEEWGFVFRLGTRVSSIRVTDIAFVHGRDELGLLATTPPLSGIADFLELLERRFDIRLQLARALIRTNLRASNELIGAWLVDCRVSGRIS